MEYLEPLNVAISDLQKMICEYGEREDKETVIKEIFERFGKIGSEYEALQNFISEFEKTEEGILESFDRERFRTNYNPISGNYEVKTDEETRDAYTKNGLRLLIYSLIREELKLLPKGNDALAQAYKDLLEGFDPSRDTDVLAILRESSDKPYDELYSDYLEMKKEYSGVIKTLGSSSLEEIEDLVNKKGVNDSQKKLSEWCLNARSLAQLDPVFLDKISLVDLSLLRLIWIKKEISLIKKSDQKKLGEFISDPIVQDILDPKELDFYTSNPVVLKAFDPKYLLKETGKIGGKRRVLQSIEKMSRKIRTFIRRQISNLKNYVEKMSEEYPEPEEWYLDWEVVQPEYEEEIKKTSLPIELFYLHFFRPPCLGKRIPSSEERLFKALPFTERPEELKELSREENALEERIIEVLKEGPMPGGKIRDLIGLERYSPESSSTLVRVLEGLIEKGRVRKGMLNYELVERGADKHSKS